MTRDDLPPSSGSEQPLLDPGSEARLRALLRAAWSPAEIDPERNRTLIELALEDPLAPPTEAELIESERLRDALEGKADHPDAALARALRAAVAPRAQAPAPELPLPA